MLTAMVAVMLLVGFAISVSGWGERLRRSKAALPAYLLFGAYFAQTGFAGPSIEVVNLVFAGLAFLFAYDAAGRPGWPKRVSP